MNASNLDAYLKAIALKALLVCKQCQGSAAGARCIWEPEAGYGTEKESTNEIVGVWKAVDRASPIQSKTERGIKGCSTRAVAQSVG